MKHERGTGDIKTYFPLIVIAAIVVLAAVALNAAGMPFMTTVMGLFFIILAMFKFFDLKGFADGFQTYDLIAQQYRQYAYAYPFIELVLGLAYLSGAVPVLTNLVTLAVMSVSAVGVLKGIASGKHLKCACLGSVLNVPLSTVSVVENVGMGFMALLALLR